MMLRLYEYIPNIHDLIGPVEFLVYSEATMQCWQWELKRLEVEVTKPLVKQIQERNKVLFQPLSSLAPPMTIASSVPVQEVIEIDSSEPEPEDTLDVKAGVYIFLFDPPPGGGGHKRRGGAK